MANISITVGQITSTITVSDSVAQEILSDYAAEYKLNQMGSPQDRLNEVTEKIVQNVQEAANAYNQRIGAETERNRIEETLRNRRWR